LRLPTRFAERELKLTYLQ
jgi:hypothetical protein